MSNSQSLFWAIGLDQDVAKALDVAMSKIDSVALANGRLITQISHTTTVLSGSQPSLKALFTRMGDNRRIDLRGEYIVVTACATTVSMH